MRRHVLVLVEALPYPLDPRVRAQVAALRGAGCHVTVACPTGPGAERRDVTIDGVRVRRFAAPRPGRGAVGYLAEYAIAFVRLARIVRAVRGEQRVDAVLVCGPPDLLVALARPLARRGAAVVFDYRELSPELFEAKFGRRGAAYRALVVAERYAFRHADAVMTVSEACAELARERGGIEGSRVFLVGNGPDPQRVHAVAPRPELRRGRSHLVLWLGMMSVQEGLHRLIDAAEHVVRIQRRTDVQFAIVGPGEVREDLRREVDRRGLGAFVDLPGLVADDQVRAYIATADVCVGVDERNAMNDRAAMRKVLEYMALGKAVVQYPLPEMQRLCGDACVYARDGDAGDLALRICEILDDDRRRRGLGEAARRRVWSGLMWPQQVPELLASFDYALSTRDDAPASGSRRFVATIGDAAGTDTVSRRQEPAQPRPSSILQSAREADR